MTINSNDTKKSRTYYVTYPGNENHSYKIPGKKIIKTGIYNDLENPQDYVHKRYMKGSPLLASGRVSKITFNKMYEIEQNVLYNLKKEWKSYMREHFIISEYEERKFVDHVKNLYDYFTNNRHLLT